MPTCSPVLAIEYWTVQPRSADEARPKADAQGYTEYGEVCRNAWTDMRCLVRHQHSSTSSLGLGRSVTRPLTGQRPRLGLPVTHTHTLSAPSRPQPDDGRLVAAGRDKVAPGDCRGDGAPLVAVHPIGERPTHGLRSGCRCRLSSELLGRTSRG